MPTIVLTLLIFISCASQSWIETEYHQIFRPTGPTPEWVLTSNSNSYHWIGVGFIEKPFSGNIREVACSRAVNEIASQISIQISSNFTNVMTEYNYDINEFTKSIIESRVDNNLEDIEYLNFHEDEYSFYVQARLSKQKYFESLAKKRENATETSLGYIRRADSELNGETFNLLQSAMDEIIQFIDEPIQVEYEGKGQNLYSLIKLKFQDKINQIQLVPEHDEINITFGFSNGITILVTSRDKISNRYLSGIPIILESSDGQHTISGITGSDGRLILPLPEFSAYTSQKQIYLSVDIQKLNLSTDEISKTPISIKLTSPTIFVSIDEKLLGKRTDNPIIGPQFKEFFAVNLSAKFAESQSADLFINGTVNTSKKSDNPNEWGIYQTFADATITIINGRTGDEIYSVTISKIQGADFNSNEGSAKESIKNISKNLETKVLPEILKRMQEL